MQIMMVVFIVIAIVVGILNFVLVRQLNRVEEENKVLKQGLTQSKAFTKELSDSIKEITAPQLKSYSQARHTLMLLTKSFTLLNEIFATTTDASVKIKITEFSSKLFPVPQNPSVQRTEARIFQFKRKPKEKADS